MVSYKSGVCVYCGHDEWVCYCAKCDEPRRTRQMETLDILFQRPGIHGTVLAEMVGYTKTGMYYHLRKLIEAGLVMKVDANRRQGYRLTPAGMASIPIKERLKRTA